MLPASKVNRLTETLRVPALILSAAIIIMDLGLDVGPTFLGHFACAALGLVLIWPYKGTPLGAIMLFCAASLYFLPGLAMIYVGYDLKLTWFVLFNVVALLILSAGIDLRTMLPRSHRWEPAPEVSTIRNLVFVTLWMGAGLLATLTGTNVGALLLATWGVSLVHMERLARANKIGSALAAGAIICAFVALFAALVWSGGGRIIVVSLLLGPFLIGARYTRFGVPGLALAVVGVLLGFIGRVMRFGFSEGLAGVADDSGTSHLYYSTELWANPAKSGWSSSFWDQYILLFANVFPRDIWPDKPLGINYTFVDYYIGRTGLGEEHSTALGYFGEHIFYSTGFWPLLVALITLTIILVRWLLVRISGPYLVLTVNFDVWLITFFWGGMAVFGSRVWLTLVPCLIYLMIFRWLDRRASAGRRGGALAGGAPLGSVSVAVPRGA